MKPRRLDGEPQRLSDLRPGARIDAGVQERAGIAHELRALVLLVALGRRRQACRVDPEEDVRVRPQLLEHDDVDVESGEIGGRERDVLEGLRADPDDDAP